MIFLYSLKTRQLLELDSFASEQVRDPFVREVFNFMRSRQLPEDKVLACKIALQESLFTILDGILYYLDPKHSNRKQAVVPKQLQKQILEDAHSGLYGGHFCGRMYSSLMLHWWWERMFSDAIKFTKACPICAVTTGTGRKTKPPLHPIPMQRPFQILGIDVMDLPQTERGNKHVVVIQELFPRKIPAIQTLAIITMTIVGARHVYIFYGKIMHIPQWLDCVHACVWLGAIIAAYARAQCVHLRIINPRE